LTNGGYFKLKNIIMKQKMSQFEFSIMETIQPEEAKKFKPRTDAEELNLRQQKILKQVKNLFISHTTRGR
jgi:hypothetical protein